MSQTVHIEGQDFVQTGDDRFLLPCVKCGGDGQHWAHWRENGVCFACNGRGYNANAKARTRVEAGRFAAAKAAKRAAEAEAARKAQAERDAARAAREAKWAAERAEQAARSAHLDAAPGAKVTLTGTVKYTKDIPSPYYGRGDSRLVIVTIDDEHEVKFFSAAAFVWGLHSGDAVTVTATVKQHEDYQGRKSTLLVRPKQQEVALAA